LTARPEMTGAMTVIAADRALLDTLVDGAGEAAEHGLTGPAAARLHAAVMKTPWASRCQRSFALVDGATVLASAERYDMAGVYDGRPMRISGIGSVFTSQRNRGRGFSRLLIQTLLDDSARDGADMALLFTHRGADQDEREGFCELATTDLTLNVIESSRYGAPMMLVRGGEERDLAAIVAMGRIRAERFRIHLDRDGDFIRYVSTRKRLRSALGPAHARQLQFFIAEEGITAAAYVIISVSGETWTLEECGDRDPSGARVGALLQALIAREPSERRPTIQGWLPAGFLPPQVTIASATPGTELIGLRMLDSSAAPHVSADDVLFWRNDFL
jgi:GNAT superfamily N-acetyltransferase